MESKIVKKEKNPFLSREELILEIESEKTPTFEEIKKEIGSDENLIVVKRVNSNFGKQKFSVEAVVYDSTEAKEKIETVPQKVRKKMEAEKKAAEDAAKKAAEEAKKAEEEAKAAEAETPAEEPKEEAPAEETKPEEKTE